MYILDPLHYKEKWEEVLHVKKKRKLSVDRVILQKSLEAKRHEKEIPSPTKCLLMISTPVQTEQVQHGTGSLHHKKMAIVRTNQR